MSACDIGECLLQESRSPWESCLWLLVTDRNKVLTTNGRMQFWLPKMDETAIFEIWWWRWQCHSFRTETIIILSLTLYIKCMEGVTDKWFKLSEPLLLYKQHLRRWERHTSILLPCIAILSLSLSYFQSKKKWWELISGSSSITISSPCVIRWALINPVFFNEIIVTLFLCDTVEDFRFWGLVWFFWFFQ